MSNEPWKDSDEGNEPWQNEDYTERYENADAEGRREIVAEILGNFDVFAMHPINLLNDLKNICRSGVHIDWDHLATEEGQTKLANAREGLGKMDFDYIEKLFVSNFSWMIGQVNDDNRAEFTKFVALMVGDLIDFYFAKYSLEMYDLITNVTASVETN